MIRVVARAFRKGIAGRGTKRNAETHLSGILVLNKIHVFRIDAHLDRHIVSFAGLPEVPYFFVNVLAASPFLRCHENGAETDGAFDLALASR